MTEYTFNEKLIIVQYAIEKYDNEKMLLEKLQSVLSEKDSQRSIDTLIGTQRVRRIGPEILDRKSTRLNSSHVSESRMPSSA